MERQTMKERIENGKIRIFKSVNSKRLKLRILSTISDSKKLELILQNPWSSETADIIKTIKNPKIKVDALKGTNLPKIEILEIIETMEDSSFKLEVMKMLGDDNYVKIEALRTIDRQ